MNVGNGRSLAHMQSRVCVKVEIAAVNDVRCKMESKCVVESRMLLSQFWFQPISPRTALEI